MSAPSAAWSDWYSAMKSAWLNAVADFSSYRRRRSGEGRWLTLRFTPGTALMVPLTRANGGGGGADLHPSNAPATAGTTTRSIRFTNPRLPIALAAGRMLHASSRANRALLSARRRIVSAGIGHA
jgi:hypothetical protein